MTKRYRILDGKLRDSPDGLSRPEFEPEHVALIIDRPRNYSSTDEFLFTVADALEDKIQRATENRHLINLFTLEKSLVYYQNSIHSNGVAIEKLKTNAARVGFPQENLEYLGDLIIENAQCYRQAEIYSNIFASLMDAVSPLSTTISASS